MRRVLFRIGTVPIYSYPALLYVGIVLGLYAQMYAGLLRGIAPVRTLVTTLALLTSALLGARLLFVFPRWQYYRAELSRIWRFSDGGASMYGGLFLAVPLSVPITRAEGLPFAAFWDTAAFTMLIGMIVTRVGCFLNGCCAGRPTRAWYGINLPDERGIWARRIPNQVLEAAWGLIVLAGAIGLWRQGPFEGAVILFVLGAYGAGRIGLECLRDAQDRIRGVRLQQAISIALVATAVAGFTVAWWR
jgi:phosphatidylglycerol---prolipoprotein diacylglyceryl transferase